MTTPFNNITGAAIGIKLGFGYPGGYSRNGDYIVRNRIVNSTSQPIPFGAAVMLSSDEAAEGTWKLADSTLTMTNFAGVAVREVKTATSYFDQSQVSYQATQPCDVIERGSVTVMCYAGTPTAGSKVYVRIALNSGGISPNGVLGGFEAVADGANSIEITNAKWTGGKDGNNIAELTLLSSNLA